MRAISTDQAAPPGGPFSQAVIAGDFVYLAGAVPRLPDGSWVRGAFAEQARAAFTNLARAAQAAGTDLDRAVRVGVYLREWNDFAEMNEIFAEYFAGPVPPVRTTLPVALTGFDIEADAVLYTGS
ncbi:RidA family protein [Phytohabitans houttuyneae]|uniref:Reactive intermediate/imine deaminase n=1 Tax=Phytohabitans houttuyneae TaxID=1076126 RepID=A0A6V8KQC1_9ACTN|nr:RidA family protein [Phytohabitans houttuyneae]GFJ84056.1 reactive intermediate/imine deaminase [Phytohabitans houttuyneae]